MYSVFALGEAGVFGMPEHEVLHAELRCRFAGFTDRAVVLFVGLEAVAVRIEAESFTEEPAAASRVFPGLGAYRVRRRGRRAFCRCGGPT